MTGISFLGNDDDGPVAGWFGDSGNLFTRWYILPKLALFSTFLLYLEKEFLKLFFAPFLSSLLTLWLPWTISRFCLK